MPSSVLEPPCSVVDSSSDTPTRPSRTPSPPASIRLPVEPSPRWRAPDPTVAESLDPRALPVYGLYRRLRRDLLSLDSAARTDAVVEHFLDAVVAVADEQGASIVGGRVYRRAGDCYELIARRGDAGRAELGFRVPVDYPVIGDLLAHGWLLVRSDDPRRDPWIEAPLDGATFAAAVLGDGAEYLLALTLEQPVDDLAMAHALASLGSIADMTLDQRSLVRSLDEARRVQTSLLLSEPPEVEGFDIAFRSVPAESVGGDIYDLHAVQEGTLGVAVGDACGHGLGAALQARDLVVGLRMGVEQNLKMVSTFERLARVMAASGPPGRFISLFYCEIDRDGTLVYVNGGHVPPLVVRADGRVETLDGTGPVLGIELASRLPFRRAFSRLEPGDRLVLYTDGITEAADGTDRELGVEQLAEIVSACGLSATSADVVDRVFEAVDAFSGQAPAADDRTLLIVGRELGTDG